MSHSCGKCGSELHAIKDLCTDSDGMREDQYCPECNTRWGLRSHGLVLLSEAIDRSTIAQENRELKITLRKILELQKENSEKPVPLAPA